MAVRLFWISKLKNQAGIKNFLAKKLKNVILAMNYFVVPYSGNNSLEKR